MSCVNARTTSDFGSTLSSNRLLCINAADRERAVESVDTFNTKKWCILALYYRVVPLLARIMHLRTASD